MKSQNRKIDEKLAEQVEQYTALNDTLKLELPKLSALNENLKDICLARLITTQVGWYSIWNDKLKTVLEQNELPKDLNDILDKFNRDFKHQDAKAQSMGILNGSTVASARGRLSQSTARDEEVSVKSKSRASTSTTNNRARGLSTQSEATTSDQIHRSTEQPRASLVANSVGLAVVALGGRPDGRLSVESSDRPRPSGESAHSGRRSLLESSYTPTRWTEGFPAPEPSFSDAFNSALPWSNTTDSSQNDTSRRSSQAPSEPRTSYNILYVVASLHEFNIEATKTEAGYPYLTYEDGEVRNYPSTIGIRS